MYFDEIVGIKSIDKKADIIRYAVRAIITKNNQVFMIQTKDGDYMFPGGGVEKGETYEQALIREVAEETGFICHNISNVVGRVIDRKKDIFDSNKVFEMHSYFYNCELTGEVQEQKLELYEQNLEYKPVWVEINKAINKNQEYRNKLDKEDIWKIRDILVLNHIKGL